MSATVIQLGRIQALIEELAERLRESERKRQELQEQVERLEGDLAAFSDKPIKNVEEIHQKIDSYLKDIDICLEKLNGQS
jgi:predicted  nucleic acid-binding Zn-ribbon protein